MEGLLSIKIKEKVSAAMLGGDFLMKLLKQF